MGVVSLDQITAPAFEQRYGVPPSISSTTSPSKESSPERSKPAHR